MRSRNDITCPICDRYTPAKYTEEHHTVPKSRKGKEKIFVCVSCGDQVHKLFTLKELEKEFNTVEKLLADERIQKWRAWIQKKPDDFSICMMRKKKRRR